MIPSMMITPNRAMLSIIGLYNWDEAIFDQLHLPDDVNRDEVIYNILMECGELNILYPDWDFMYAAIDYWSRKELPTWQRVYNLTTLEYNPIENYDRYESEMEHEQTANDGESSNIGNETNQSASRNANNTNNSTVNKVAGYNTDALGVQSGNSQTGLSMDNEETAGTRHINNNQTASNEELRNKARNLRIHGNIGVTTPAQMIEGDLGMYDKINIVQYIVNAFKNRFCVLVY